MSWSLVAAGTDLFTGTSKTITPPVGWAAGDQLLVLAISASDSVLSWPSGGGWRPPGNHAANSRFDYAIRRMASGDTTYTWGTYPSSQVVCLVMLVLRPDNNSAHEQFEPAWRLVNWSGGVTPYAVPDVAVADDALLLHFAASYGSAGNAGVATADRGSLAARVASATDSQQVSVYSEPVTARTESVVTWSWPGNQSAGVFGTLILADARAADLPPNADLVVDTDTGALLDSWILKGRGSKANDTIGAA